MSLSIAPAQKHCLGNSSALLPMRRSSRLLVPLAVELLKVVRSFLSACSTYDHD